MVEFSVQAVCQNLLLQDQKADRLVLDLGLFDLKRTEAYCQANHPVLVSMDMILSFPQSEVHLNQTLL
jgi:hypothetical protein